MMQGEDADVDGEAQQRNIQDAMIHLKTAFPDVAPALLMDVLTAHQFNRDAAAEALLSMRSDEQETADVLPPSSGSTSVALRDEQPPFVDRYSTHHGASTQQSLDPLVRQGDGTAQDLMIQQDEAIARQLQEELYLEDDLQALGRQRNAGGSSARSSALLPSSAQNWSMYNWGESAMSNIQSTVGQLGQGLSQIFQTTYDFLAGSVQQTISSASACTADTRAVEDRDDVYYQEEHQSSGRSGPSDDGGGLPLSPESLDEGERDIRASSSSIDHGGLVRRSRRNPHSAQAGRGKDD